MKRKEAFYKGPLYQILRPYRWWVALLSFLTVLESMLQVLLAVLTSFVIDSALSASADFAQWGVALLADGLLLVLLHSGISWMTGSVSDRVGMQLRYSMLSCGVYGRQEAYRSSHSGHVMNRAMADVRTICDGVFVAIPSFIGQLTRLAGTFLAVFLIYKGITLVLFLAAVAVIGMVALLRPVLKKHHRKVRQKEEKIMATLQEDLQQLELIQSIGVQKEILSRFAKNQKEGFRAKNRRRVWSVGSNGVVYGVSQLGSCVLLLWGVSQVVSGAISYGSLTSLLQLLSLFRGPVLSISGVWNRMTSVEVAAERLRELLAAEEEKNSTGQEDFHATAVVFENVTFSYPGEAVPVLQNFSAAFPLDGWTCLTGISGKGKSTVFKLMLGLHTPEEGRVYLETDRGQIPCGECTRKLFAYVPQDYAMFSGTVLENMQLVKPDVDAQALHMALSVARADFVVEMEHKEHTHLGENNTGLSMGQIQRLAIARAVLMDRSVFLLDECTSALDGETEAAVLEGLRTLGKHAILVTHRPEALQNIPGIREISMGNE